MPIRVATSLALVLGLLLVGCEMPAASTMDSAVKVEVAETPTPESVVPAWPTVQVTGRVVNVRSGPGLE